MVEKIPTPITPTPQAHPLDTVHLLLKLISEQAPSMQTSVTNPDGTLNKSAGEGAAPIPTTPAPTAAATPAPKPEPQRQALGVDIGQQTLTDAILNNGQIMPLQKAQLSQGFTISQLLGNKEGAGDGHAASHAANAISVASKLVKLFA